MYYEIKLSGRNQFMWLMNKNNLRNKIQAQNLHLPFLSFPWL